jgi:hypothetical protein
VEGQKRTKGLNALAKELEAERKATAVEKVGTENGIAVGSDCAKRRAPPVAYRGKPKKPKKSHG